MSATGSGTNINTNDAVSFSDKALDINQRMGSLLTKTQNAVMDATSPAIWHGDASKQFGNVTERYNASATKLRNHMQEIMELVKQGAGGFQNKEAENKANIAKVGINLG
jgi:uncharacterized protein YukE